MARKEITQFFDDLDNSPLTEEEVRVVNYSIDDAQYVIDLSPQNEQKFRELLAPYIEVSRRTIRTLPYQRRTPRPAARNTMTRKIRQWALDQGKEVKLRGKIPAEIIEAYYAAHPDEG